jgi:transcription factor SFP1
MMMSGTSPFAFQSPSYHSSSYLPKLEANFMKDFSCCGLTLPTLHDLLQHYEESHAQKDPVLVGTVQPQLPDTRAALAANTANQVQQEAQQRMQQTQSHPNQNRFGSSSQFNQQQSQRGFSNTLQTIPDMDTVEDMEMDDIDGANETTPPPNFYTNHTATNSPQTPYTSLQQAQVPQLNTSMMQGHQAYRQSAPNTPVATSRASAFQGNNASSTLSANPMQQFQDLQNPYRNTPDSSAPGTPGAELDESLMVGMDDMSMQQNALFPGFPNMPEGFGGNFGFGTNSDMIDLCIDEPAKRLFQQARNNIGQNSAHQRLGSGQYGANSDIARTIRERQIAAGLPDTTTNILPHEEPKPFRCPVIGCEKAYKNQNGLKYHKSVSII